MEVLDSLVIGAGQAGLSTSYHLTAHDVPHVVLDADDRAGGAWQHRWDSLTMLDLHGIAELPDAPAPPPGDEDRANDVVPDYFAEYERRNRLPVERPVQVDQVVDERGILRVEAGERSWLARTLVNATGTWSRPFVPHYAGIESFAGQQFHTIDYPGPEALAGLHVVVVGGGASAVQFLGELASVAETTWVTRRPPVWRTDEFTPEAGRAAVALVEERVSRGLPPESVVGVTGLMLRPQEAEAQRLGAYERRPMFDRIEPDGVRWAGSDESVSAFVPADAIVWATGFRPAIAHLAPLHLRSVNGGIQLDGTTAVADPRVQLVGYGPSASTIGANRAGRVAARSVRGWLADHTGPE